MLKEQAISLLTQVKEIILGSESWLDSTHQPIEEAFSMAIEALKQSMQTNVPNVLNALDTIYRQAAIDALYHVDEHNGRSVEAIRNLPSAQPELGKNSPSEQHKMDKLGVKTEETCTDIISRQAAIDAILECCTSDFDNEYECGYDDGLRQGVHRLKHLPSAQPDVPDRKVGKWIEEVGMLMCSECGDAWGTEQFDEVMSFNFCPNCGAKMEIEG